MRDWLRSPGRAMVGVFLLALAVRALTALPLEQPGYFDAYYYYDVAENLYLNRGFIVDFIWNYLDNPSSVSHPSNLYWMPFPSILAYLSFLVFGLSYRASQVPFIILSALPPVLAYYLSHRLFGKPRYGLIAAVLVIFSGFYLPYWVSPDNFTPFGVATSFVLLALSYGLEKGRPFYFGLAGLLMGISHLTRADGLLLWVVLGSVLLVAFSQRKANLWGAREFLLSTLFALGGYLLVMGPWFYRNWGIVGAPLSGAGTKTLFLRRYDDIFSYAKDLTWQGYLAWGWGAILGSKLRAAAHNGLVILGALLFYLVPFVVIGGWQVRRQRLYQPFFLYAALLYLTMTFLFTFPSMRGSMLHSTTALLPFLFALAPPGIDAFVESIARRRQRWHPPTARTFFSLGFTGLAILISLFLYSQGIFFSISAEPILPLWNERNKIYIQVAQLLEGDTPVMVVDPPAYYYFTHRPALVIPNEEIGVILEVAHRYGADYLILERDHVSTLSALYRGEMSHPSLHQERILTDPLGDRVMIYRLGE